MVSQLNFLIDHQLLVTNIQWEQSMFCLHIAHQLLVMDEDSFASLFLDHRLPSKCPDWSVTTTRCVLYDNFPVKVTNFCDDHLTEEAFLFPHHLVTDTVPAR